MDTDIDALLSKISSGMSSIMMLLDRDLLTASISVLINPLALVSNILTSVLSGGLILFSSSLSLIRMVWTEISGVTWDFFSEDFVCFRVYVPYYSYGPPLMQ